MANGVPTRKMERIAPKMGIERLSKDQVSAMCRSLDAEVGELAARGLAGVEVPHLFRDATYVKCRRDGRVQSTAVVTAIGTVKILAHFPTVHRPVSGTATPPTASRPGSASSPTRSPRRT